MKNQVRMLAGLVLLITVAIITGCGGSDPVFPLHTSYAIGDTGPSGVGKVFYITDGGLHGLEAAPVSWNGGVVDPLMIWMNGGTTQTLNGNTLTGIGTGLQNSNFIIAQVGHTTSAAKLCRDYTGGGKTDWFLPSKDELAQMYAQKAVVGGITATWYWSSSESGKDTAWTQRFTDGLQMDDSSKWGDNYVRAVRAF